MNNTIKSPQKSRVSPKNPYDATGLSDRKITSPIEALLSRISGNFGKISQNSLNFTARVGLGTAQKIMIGGVA
jgi:hypothetical protein